MAEGAVILKSPKVSVVMSLYNSAKYLREAIDSVLAQTFTDFEFIIIDDGSKDEGADIVRSYTDSRIRFIQQQNKGLPAALNAGIQVARSELIARMDPDDICFPNRLAMQYEFMLAHLNVCVLGSAAVLVEECGREICVFKRPELHDKLLKILPGSPFIHPSVMFRKDVFLRVGMYPEYMRFGGEDACLFGKMSQQSEIRNLSLPLIKYRIVPTAMSRRPAEFRYMLIDITQKVIDGKNINERLLKDLRESYSVKSELTNFYYHCDVARMYLWSGDKYNRSRFHLIKALRIKVQFELIVFLFVTFLPGCFVRQVYNRLKGQCFF